MLTNKTYLLEAIKDITLTSVQHAVLQDFIADTALIHFAINTSTITASTLTIAFKDWINERASYLVITWNATTGALTSFSNNRSASAFVAADYDAAKTAYLADTSDSLLLTALLDEFPAVVTSSTTDNAFPDWTTDQIDTYLDSNSKYFFGGFFA